MRPIWYTIVAKPVAVVKWPRGSIDANESLHLATIFVHPHAYEPIAWTVGAILEQNSGSWKSCNSRCWIIVHCIRSWTCSRVLLGNNGELVCLYIDLSDLSSPTHVSAQFSKQSDVLHRSIRTTKKIAEAKFVWPDHQKLVGNLEKVCLRWQAAIASALYRMHGIVCEKGIAVLIIPCGQSWSSSIVTELLLSSHKGRQIHHLAWGNSTGLWIEYITCEKAFLHSIGSPALASGRTNDSQRVTVFFRNCGRFLSFTRHQSAPDNRVPLPYNGIVERFNRNLKSAFDGSPHWSQSD